MDGHTSQHGILTVATLITLSLGCGEADQLRSGPAELDHGSLVTHQLAAQTIYESAALGLPFDLALIKNALVVTDLAADSALHVIDSRTGGLIRAFGRRGEGPGEFKNPWSIDPDPSDPHAFRVYDVGLGRSTRVDVRGSFTREEMSAEIVHFRADGPALGPVRIHDDQFLSLGFFGEGRLVVFARDGTYRESRAALPPGSADVPARVRQHAYQSTLATNPNRTMFAAAHRHGGAIEIYRRDGSLVAITSRPFSFTPRYSIRQGMDGPAMATGADLRFGYIDAVGTSDRLYAIFSGRTREGGRGRQTFGRFVHVFDWKGEFLSAYQLDRDLLSITVDERGEWLYGVTHDPAPAVVQFPIPKSPPTPNRFADN